VPTLDSVLQDALSLPPPARGQIIHRLIESLEGGEDDPAAEDAWAEVIAKRIADLDSGQAKVIDAKAALARAREELRRQRE
jgi:hypothetical protein